MTIELKTLERITAQGELKPFFLPPCEESVKLYEFHRKQRILNGTYRPGIILPLNSNQEGLRGAFGLNGDTSSKELGVYNITAPFQNKDRTVLAGRLQRPGMNLHSKVLFFDVNNGYQPINHIRRFDLEDPFVTKIGDLLIFGGISAYEDSSEINYQSTLYVGENIEDLEEFVRGPLKIKGVRITELRDGRIGLFTRPQGIVGGLGQIGFTTLDSLDQLNADVIAHAPLIAQRFPEGEWGGVNGADTLEDGRIVALGHRAYFDKNNHKRYYPWLFIHNPDTGESEDLGIIGADDDFPLTPARAPYLYHAIYPGKIDWKNNMLYAGVRDFAAGALHLPSLAEIMSYRNFKVISHQANTRQLVTA